MRGFSPKFPLQRSNKGGVYGVNTTFKDTIQQNFKNLILTNNGERVMDVNFGVGIRSYFFEPKTSTISADISDKIHFQVKKYMPFITINSIEFTGGDDDSNLLGVSITYTIVPLEQKNQLTISSDGEGI
jgi:phage baseplate assembly protein W